ncbi:hypothetical protein Micbo1qcDRAFT_65330 [Microdochium bolleyi]|uniref:Uncharacterized protein n=1 Tax=Microdochium bolleyi TaxID=196109 RepID=A0A136J2N0_9PEZI|nr:hypothetical protein Micbo1qcDRAFT_65330 [Microdochium bolleyi]
MGKMAAGRETLGKRFLMMGASAVVAGALPQGDLSSAQRDVTASRPRSSAGYPPLLVRIGRCAHKKPVSIGRRALREGGIRKMLSVLMRRVAALSQ